MSLYDLPKDMLITLISRIREDVLAENRNERRLLKIYQESTGYHILKCNQKECDNVHIISREDEYCYDSSDIYPIYCNRCFWRNKIVYCDAHKTNIRKFSAGTEYEPHFVCNDCSHIYERLPEWHEIC